MDIGYIFFIVASFWVILLSAGKLNLVTMVVSMLIAPLTSFVLQSKGFGLIVPIVMFIASSGIAIIIDRIRLIDSLK